MTREEVLALASEDNPIVNATGNKIEFADGTTYARESFGIYRKVKNYTL